MAGSKKYFVYRTDKGDEFALLADESNTEAVNSQVNDYADGVSIIYELPRNITPRHLVYTNTAGTRKIRCYALTPEIFAGAPIAVPTIPDPLTPNQTLTLKKDVPEERKRFPISIDTGLTDGDAT